jgi:hypothetical protein
MMTIGCPKCGQKEKVLECVTNTLEKIQDALTRND